MNQVPNSGTPRPGLQLPPRLANAPVRTLMQPLARFLEIESASGVLLVICTGAALLIANSVWAHEWEAFWHLEMRVVVGSWELRNTLGHWINDGLMTIFFFVVGLEIKRETVEGELRSFQKATLPIFAALGGMLIPAGIYLLLQPGGAAARGWGIPMATDIAFAVGILALLGRRVPSGLKIFLLALAIADDIGAIIIIACFYSEAIQVIALGIAGVGLLVVLVLNWLGVRNFVSYFLLGAMIWLAMFRSGIHPTVAGVVLGLMTPGRAWISQESFTTMMLDFIDRLDGRIDRPQALGKLTLTARETISPLERLESALHPWVAFAIMPVFALANAGVQLQPAAAFHPVTWSVAAGLLVGKPLGILAFSWLAVRTNLAKLPQGTNWKSLSGAACLGGIGFTMSLFIAGLALKGQLLDSAKIGTLAGSVLSALLGYTLLRFSLPNVTVAGEVPEDRQAKEAEELST
ncbi:Na(+)/H(+) antiporter NhaA [Anatilimnocola aggregata]|uniref:Na(+)/H(+) antiporter NhaA n=1 Tax=Anatilimnocola aggregata TaxID=2528021 RepID=A0A517Y7P2_9BACT|nr:Na+/H+ antiporter NhaA [Anatilimnocola aggregata]QDU26251.1 Na(+)/H(+) antiporter NhaA [Anatilimnocola aggregata]